QRCRCDGGDCQSRCASHRPAGGAANRFEQGNCRGRSVRMSVSAYFSRHAQVLIGSLGRIVNQPFATLMTMGVIAVALALPLFLSLLLQNARSATGNWNEAYDLSVYMDKKAGAARTQSLAKTLKARGDVAAVRVITADQALAEFRGGFGFWKALDALPENTLPAT